MCYLCTRKRQGALVQLVRIHACHAWGHGFESRTHRLMLFEKSSKRALSSAGSERLPYKQRVGGSNPSAPTNRILFEIQKKNFLLILLSVLGRLAQLVQSVCLTSRGSAVRIRQRPPTFFVIIICSPRENKGA